MRLLNLETCLRHHRSVFFNLRQAIAVFREVEGAEHAPVAMLQIFVEVAMSPGCDIPDLQGGTRLSQGAVSRHLGMLEDGIPNPKGEQRKGLGLIVSARSPLNYRRKQFFPTAKGRTVAIQMFKVLAPDLEPLKHEDFADVSELENFGKP